MGEDEGLKVDCTDGIKLGSVDGNNDGSIDGSWVGSEEGSTVGGVEGNPVGLVLGADARCNTQAFVPGLGMHNIDAPRCAHWARH